MTATCSKGWGARCARAKGPRCTCACGGENHGNPAARQQGEIEMTNRLTDPKVFDRPTVCGACGRTIEDHGDGAWPQECAKADFRPQPCRQWDAEPYDVIVERTPAGVTVNVPRQYVVHSPTGFEFGYGGSGPADLALNILGAFLPAPEAWRLHQDFKWQFIASTPRNVTQFTIAAAVIRDWVADKWSEQFLKEAREPW